ncbi:DUF4240 domain-containing protein [Streptomyces sp. NPDC056534]|uniref:DUF4240 domain-containing protein n=1 Tax=Streptomyces sp. NPDC056534 TaxID=3345857 RepID=UPI0036A57BD2
MKIDAWWALIDEARAVAGVRADDRNPPDDPLPAALTDVLARLSPEKIANFAVRHIEVRRSAYQWPVWGAAYLVEGGCSDDGFMDFRDGLILLGRDVFTRTLRDPDTLADLPVVASMADDDGWIGYESLSCLIKDAYHTATGETESLEVGIERFMQDVALPDEPTGECWDFDDDQETRRRLPRLAALFLM